MKNKLARWISRRLPKRLVYYAVVWVWAKATTGKYSNKIASEVTVADALVAWDPENRY